MLDYQYKAKDKVSGRIIAGTIQADNEMAAGKLLLKQNMYPVELKPKRGPVLGAGSVRGKVKAKDRVVFTRQLATLIKAGLPLAQALHSTTDQVSNKKLKEIIFRLTKSVEGGQPLSKSLEEYPENFNKIYVSMVEAGEASGKLDESLERLAVQLEKDAEIAGKVKGALIYPAIVMVVIVLVLGFMITSVVPQIATLYKSFNKPLPFITVIMIAIADALTKWWFITFPIIALAIYGAFRGFKTPQGRLFMDRAKITMPPLNQLYLKMYMARFARTLGSLVASGIPILQALALVSESVNNELIKGETLILAEEVKSGQSLAEALQKTEYFLPLVGQMIKVGEDSGTMGDMLDRLATFYENEVDQTVKNISTLIEPILIVFLGLMVVVMIMGVLFPVYNLVGGDLGSSSSSSSTK